MHRGPNSDYHRAPVPPPRYGPPAAPGAAAPPFPGPFNSQSFPPHFPGPVSYPTPLPPPGFQSFSSESAFKAAASSAQFPAGWNSLHQDDLQNLEVKKKAEEFLRILEAKDRLKPSGESGDKGTRRTGTDGEAEKRGSEKHSRGRSRSKSGSRSRGRSRAKSRARSRGKSRARSRSRGRSRSRSRGRSRGKSRTRAKSRPRSRSRGRSQGRSLARSKSQPRLIKDSQHNVKDAAAPSVSVRVPDLFQNLRQVLQSKELEKHLNVVKSTFTISQLQEDLRPTHEPQPAPSPNLPRLPTKPCEPERAADFSPNSVLPHERAGGSDSALPRILSWNDPGQKPEVFPSKCVFSSIEDEEEFLYGDEDGRKKPQAVTVPLAQTRPAENPVSSPRLSKPAVLQEPKGQAVTSRRPLTPDVSVVECEKVKNLLKTIGLNLGQADISKLAYRLKQKQEEQREVSSNSSLSRTKGQKSDDSRSHRSDSSHSHRDAEHRDKSDEREKQQREKQIQKKRKEYLVKELEGLLKHEGSGDLIPVIGFFCQRCEEFFGDLSSAEGHKHTNKHQDQQLKGEKRQREQKPTQCRDQDERSGERKRPREDSSPRRTEDKPRVQETEDGKEDETQSSKNAKKKKKKEKKMKKKDKKKEKKKKDKAEKN